MKRLILALVGVFFLFASLALAAGPKNYQVTGPVLEMKDDLIVVQKDKEKWEIAKDKDTKVTGDLKVGSKVTIQYQMKATAVEVKADDKKKEESKGKEIITRGSKQTKPGWLLVSGAIRALTLPTGPNTPAF